MLRLDLELKVVLSVSPKISHFLSEEMVENNYPRIMQNLHYFNLAELLFPLFFQQYFLIRNLLIASVLRVIFIHLLLK